jgi:hypothetical protein
MRRTIEKLSFGYSRYAPFADIDAPDRESA